MQILEHTRDPLLHEGSGLGGKAVPAFEHVELDFIGAQAETLGIVFGHPGLIELVFAARYVEQGASTF